MTSVRDFFFEMLDYTQYSSDLAPSHYQLFSNKRQHLAGNKYRSDDDVISAGGGDNFYQRDESVYINVIWALQHRQMKCANYKRDNVENI